MSNAIVQTIRLELDELATKTYCQEQNVSVDSKQLRHLRSMLEKASTLRKEAITDFARCVHDVAASTSRLSQLTLELYQEANS